VKSVEASPPAMKVHRSLVAFFFCTARCHVSTAFSAKPSPVARALALQMVSAIPGADGVAVASSDEVSHLLHQVLNVPSCWISFSPVGLFDHFAIRTKGLLVDFSLER